MTIAGEAGIVLRRFFSGATDDANGRARVAVVAVVREAGFAGALRTPGGLVTAGRETVVAVFLAGVAAGGLVDEVLSVAVEGANDILLGFADMPSFFLSSDASTELMEVLFRCDDGVEVVLVAAGFFTADRLGRAAGLLNVVVGELLVAEVVVGFDKVEVRGATGLVRGRLGGTPALVLVGLESLPSV